MNILEQFIEGYDGNWQDKFYYWTFLVYKKEEKEVKLYDIVQRFDDEGEEQDWFLQENETDQIIEDFKSCENIHDIEEWESMWLDYYPMITDVDKIEFLEQNDGLVIKVE